MNYTLGSAVNTDPYQPPTVEDPRPTEVVAGPSFLPTTPLKTLGLAVAVFPALGVIDLLVDTVSGVAESDAPNSLPPFLLLLAWAIGGYLWFRAFRL